MAGQAWGNTHSVGQARAASSGVVEELLATPGNFAFVQAVDIATRYLRRHGRPTGSDIGRFRVNPSLAFPPGDIDSLSFVTPDEGPARFEMVLNLLGLHGAGSPLPTYFTEHVAQNRDDSDPLRDFFDIFNHRIIAILYSIWGKYRYYARYEQGGGDILSKRFFGFIGAGLQEIREAKAIKWPRLMAYMGLIAMSGDAAGSLESILRHYFTYNDITIVSCVRRWVPVPEDQQTRLGAQSCFLGEDFLLGDEIRDQTGKFRILVSDLDWDNFLSFLPCHEKFDELKTVVNYVLKSRLSFDVALRLKPEEIRPWILGDDDHHTLLGWSTWCGGDGDNTVILETDFEEL